MIQLNEFKSVPDFLCSRCKKGYLIPVQKEIKEVPSASHIHTPDELYDPELYEGRFTTFTECSNKKCLESGVVSGKVSKVLSGYNDGFYDQETNIDVPPFPNYDRIYHVNYVDPIVDIINLPITISGELEQIIRESFALYWLDKSSCGNKIRVALEVLMNDLGIPKNRLNSEGVEKKLVLHRRILLYKKNDLKGANYLLALKIVGNEKSHFSDVYYADKDIITAYKILEYSLERVYEKKEEITDLLSDEIINRTLGNE